MYTLGLNAYHGDSSACIYRHNELLVATEEERIRRIKHWAGLPTEAVKFCLEEAGITLAEVDVIAISRDPQAKFMEKVWYTLRKGVKLRSILDRAKNSLNVGGLQKRAGGGLWLSGIRAQGADCVRRAPPQPPGFGLLCISICRCCPFEH